MLNKINGAALQEVLDAQQMSQICDNEYCFRGHRGFIPTAHEPAISDTFSWRNTRRGELQREVFTFCSHECADEFRASWRDEHCADCSVALGQGEFVACGACRHDNRLMDGDACWWNS